MGLTLDRHRASERFAQALTLARAGMPLPKEWLERTRKVGQAWSKTFIPVLGTALLAKATDDAVDALSLREELHKGYSARSLAEEVLVPCCAHADINIRTTGREPLNNQPFFHADRVTRALKVHRRAVADLHYLVETLERADFLRDRAALEALAAFLRVRIEESDEETPIELGPGVLDRKHLVTEVDEFLRGDDEGGKVGQAVATAILDIVFSEVRAKKVTDSRCKWPGNVGVFEKEAQILAVEVQARPATQPDVLRFAQRLRAVPLQRGFVVLLRQEGVELDVEETWYQANRLHGVDLSFFHRAGELLQEALRFAPYDLTRSLCLFPRHALARMEELDVSLARRRAWARIFQRASDLAQQA